MDMTKLIQMIVNIFLRKVVSKGVNMGVDHIARKGKPADQMTAADHTSAKAAKDAAKRARQSARLTGRLGR